MNTALWVMQALLAALFLMAGRGKLTDTVEEHVANGHLRAGQSVAPLRVLGALELLGVVGIVVPWLTGIAAILTPMTAVCFGIIMMAALVVHGRRKEYKFLPLPLIVLGLCTTVAWFRFSAL